MPLGYLEGNPQDVYAINRLGSTFSDALIGMQQNRIKQQQFMAQQALEAAYYRLAREKSMRDERVTTEDISRLRAETGKIGAETERLKGEEQRNKKDYQSGGVMADATQDLYGTDPTKNPDVAQFLRGVIAQQAARIASSNPQNIAKQSIMLGQAADPSTARLIATDTPAMVNIPRGGTLFDVGTRQPVAQGQPFIAGQRSPDQLQNDRTKVLIELMNALNKPNFENPEAQDVLREIQGDLRPGGNTNAPSGAARTQDRFGSEDEARRSGKKAGDRVYLQGVGLVELQ